MKAPPQRPKCTQAKPRAISGRRSPDLPPGPGRRPRCAASYAASSGPSYADPGQPRCAHRRPGRARGLAPSRSLPQGSRVLTSRAMHSAPAPQPPPRGDAAKEPFSHQKSRPNATAFQAGRNKVIKFERARKHILTGSNLLCPREPNSRATGATAAPPS